MRAKANPNRQMVFAGAIFRTRQGYNLIVMQYIHSHKVLVKFEDNKSAEFYVEVGNLRKGLYRNPYHPTIEGVGYEGEGLYNFIKDGRCAKMWRSMIARCFSESWRNQHPKTDQPGVQESWHNFQNFAGWFYSQLNHDVEKLELDKDILFQGNATYGPDVCCLVPGEVNLTYPKRNTQSGRSYYSITHKNFKINWRDESGKRKAKHFKVKSEAEQFKILKTKESLERVAEKYKDVITPAVYTALMSWNGFSFQNEDKQ